MSGQVFVDISMSLDGFITGPNDSVEAPRGESGDRLHQWGYDLASWRRPHGLEGGRTSGPSRSSSSGPTLIDSKDVTPSAGSAR